MAHYSFVGVRPRPSGSGGSGPRPQPPDTICATQTEWSPRLQLQTLVCTCFVVIVQPCGAEPRRRFVSKTCLSIWYNSLCRSIVQRPCLNLTLCASDLCRHFLHSRPSSNIGDPVGPVHPPPDRPYRDRQRIWFMLSGWRRCGGHCPLQNMWLAEGARPAGSCREASAGSVSPES